MKVLKIWWYFSRFCPADQECCVNSLRSGTENSSALCYGWDNKLFSGDI